MNPDLPLIDFVYTGPTARKNGTRMKHTRPINYLGWSCAALLIAFVTAADARDNPARQDIYLDAMRLIANGQKQEASDVLSQMVRHEPEHAGAWLDLAILQCELGHAEEAERLFATIITRFQPPPSILEVIAQRRMQGCAGSRPDSRTSLMLGRGFDDNVNQGASTPYFTLGTGSARIELQLLPEYLPKRDGFTIFSAEHLRGLDTAGTTGSVQFQARRNDAQKQYNTASIVVGAEHPWYIDGWLIRGGATLGVLSMGDRLYQKRSQLQANVSPPLPLPENLQFSLLAGVSHVAYPTLENFDANMWEISGLLNFRLPQVQVQASIGHSSDRALASRPGGDRQGWLAGVHGQTQVTDKILGELGWSRQTWHGESAYSPGLIDQHRSQETDTLGGALIIPVADRQAVRIELRTVKNKENISLFQYNNRLLLVNWQWYDF